MRPIRLLVATLCVIISGLSQAIPSGAQVDDSGGGAWGGRDSGTAEVSEERAAAEAVGGSPGSPGVEGVAYTHSWLDDCRFDQVSAASIIDLVFKGEESGLRDPLIDGVRVSAADTDYWLVTCNPTAIAEFAKQATRDGYFTHYAVGGRVPADAVELVRQSAYDSVPLVVFRPEMSPPGTVDHPAITQLENWLFVDDAAWASVSATASIPGLAVTVTATPVLNTWSGFDEPETVVCDVNVPYSEGMTEHPCGAFFTNKDPHVVRLVTDWEASYVCRPVVAGCSGGRLPSQQTVGEFVPVITSVVPVLTR